MMNRIGVALCASLLAVASVGVGCGDDKKESAGNGGSDDAGANNGDVAIEGDGGACDPKNLPKLPGTGLGYPDSYCGEDGCVADACDPIGRCLPACNAWALQGKVSFQAVTVSETGTPGVPPPPTGKSSEDVCPANMVSATGALNCCQRADNANAAKPALKLTSLALSRPPYFAVQAVAGVNKGAIENDLYNWVTVLSSGKDGTDLTATSGNAFPNKDGSFTHVKGPFEFAGESFNADGVWDAEGNIPGTLSTSGAVRTLKLGPTSSTSDYVMVMWMDNKYDFARLELHMRGLSWEMPLDADLNCAGERKPGAFDQVGELRGFVPLEAAKTTEVWLSRTGSQNLCTSMSGAKDCNVPVAKWQAGS